MRLKLSLACAEGATFTYNYNYLLYKAINSALQKANTISSHQYRNFGLFTFSQLYFDQYTVSREGISTQGGAVYWYISSPKIYFLEGVLKGFKQLGEITLEDQVLVLDDLEVLADPKIDSTMEFSCMSPITLMSKPGNRGKPRFGRIEDRDFNDRLRQDLVNKFYRVFDTLPSGEELSIKFNRCYIEKRRRVSRLVDYNGLKVLGYMVPFVVEGNPQLIQVGYQLGFGHRNNCGFGMVKIWHSPEQSEKDKEDVSEAG